MVVFHSMKLDHSTLYNLIKEEQKLVTFKWLKRKYDLSNNSLYKLLRTFCEDYLPEFGNSLHITYRIYASKKDDLQAFSVILVNKSNLDDIKKDYNIIQQDIYAISSLEVKDFDLFYILDYDIPKLSDEELLKDSFIRDNSIALIKSRVSGDHLHSQNQINEDFPARNEILSIKSSPKIANPTHQNDAIGPVPTSPKKVKLATVVDKPVVALTDKSKKEVATRKKPTLAKPPATKDRGKMVKGPPKKTGDKGPLSKLMEENLTSEDDDVSPPSAKRDSVSPLAVLDPVSSVSAPGISIRDDSGDEELDSEEPTPRKHRKLVSKTYLNEEGFLVTEKVWETLTTPIDEKMEEQVDTKAKVTPPAHVKPKSKQAPSEKGKKGSDQVAPPKVPKVAPTNSKGTGAKGPTKQASLTDFFKRK